MVFENGIFHLLFISIQHPQEPVLRLLEQRHLGLPLEFRLCWDLEREENSVGRNTSFLAWRQGEQSSLQNAPS